MKLVNESILEVMVERFPYLQKMTPFQTDIQPEGLNGSVVSIRGDFSPFLAPDFEDHLIHPPTQLCSDEGTLLDPDS